MKHIHTFESFLKESHLWDGENEKLTYGSGGNGTDKETLEYLWKITRRATPSYLFEEPIKETNKSKKEELIKRLGLMADAHHTEKEALRAGEYFLEMWKKEHNMKYDKKTVFESFLNENNKKIVDYSDSKNKIIVGLKTNLLSDMLDRYESQEDGNNIHFF